MRRRSTPGRWLPLVVAALVPPVVFLSGLWANDQAPFGPVGRSLNDLGYQFEPLHALL